jgi:hypothetical protein
MLLVEAQVKAGISFSSLSRTFLDERTGQTDLRLKVSHKTFFLAAWMNHPRLSLRTGDLGRLPGLCLFDFEICQVEFLRTWNSAANGGLDLFDMVILNGLVYTGSAIPPFV